MTVEMAISYANMLSYLSYKSGFCSVPVNVFNRMVEVQDLKAGVREDFNRNNTYRIIEKNNGEAEFSFLHGNNGDIKVLLDQLWNDLDFLSEQNTTFGQ